MHDIPQHEPSTLTLRDLVLLLLIKYAEIFVRVPVRGTIKEKLSNAGSVNELPIRVTPGIELPNPTRAGVPTNPNASVFKVTTEVPDANGITELAPGNPCVPVSQ